jgi:glycosyl transferase family 25
MSSVLPPKLSIVVINLEKRTDRRLEASEELAKLGVESSAYHIFAAKPTPQNGAMGCSLSHAMALARWLFDTEDEHCLLLEDDFCVRSPDTFWGLIGEAAKFQNDWDVFMLASNTAVPIEKTPISNVYRIVHGLSASAYLVRRQYAPKLIEAFFRSAELFRVYGDVPTLQNRAQRRVFALDALWMSLQLDDRYWACLPQMCFQRPSYSDIENRFMDYGV